jgi:hypothetical protein
VTQSAAYAEEPRSNGSRRRRRDLDDEPDWTPPPRSRARPEPPEESWTDQKLRERYGSREPRPSYDQDGEAWQRGDTGQWQRPISGEPISRGRRRRWEDDSSADLRQSSPDLRYSSPDLRYSSPDLRYSSPDLRTGEVIDGDADRLRWAALRSDGPEPGGRRSARHSDDRGSQPSYEDRWTPPRAEANGNGNGNGNGSAGVNGSANGNGHRRPDYSRDRPDYSRRALPPGASSEPPAWNESWEEPARETRGHRYRPDFELTDERWR